MKNAADQFVSAGIKIKHVGWRAFMLDTKDDDPNFKIEDLKNELNKCFGNSKYDLSFEPGRYLIAEAGILITSIITMKQNGGINYLIVDARMNTLVRPTI